MTHQWSSGFQASASVFVVRRRSLPRITSQTQTWWIGWNAPDIFYEWIYTVRPRGTMVTRAWPCPSSRWLMGNRCDILLTRRPKKVWRRVWRRIVNAREIERYISRKTRHGASAGISPRFAVGTDGPEWWYVAVWEEREIFCITLLCEVKKSLYI